MIPSTNHNMWVGWIYILDLPVSLAADLILLPLTIPWELMQASKEAERDPK